MVTRQLRQLSGIGPNRPYSQQKKHCCQTGLPHRHLALVVATIKWS